MSFRTLSAVLRGTWLIQRDYANNQLPLIAAMLEGKSLGGPMLTGVGEMEKPYIVNSGEKFPLMVYDWQTDKYVVNTNIPENSVGVLPIIGPVTKYAGDCGEPGSITRMGWLDTFNNSPNINGTIALIDSPGGQADGTPQFSDAIKQSAKPVLSLVSGGAYSAGYWFASGAPEVYLAHESDGLGSIGAYTTLLDFRGYFEQKGIKIHEIYPDESEDKNKNYRDAINGRPAGMKQDVANLALSFRAAVSANRGDRLTSDDWNTGSVYSAKDAVDMGLADGIMDFDNAVDRVLDMAKQGSAPPSTKVYFSQNHNQKNMFGNKFSALSAMVGVAAAAVTLDQVKAVNAQIAENNISGVTLCLDSELAQHEGNATKITGLEATITANSEKVNGLETKITGLESQISAKDTEIASLKAKIAMKPAEQSTDGAGANDTPPPAAPDADKNASASIETQTDRDLKAMQAAYQTI